MPYTEMITRLEKAMLHVDKTNEQVSKRGVDWHLEHSLKIIKSISNAVADSKPEDYKPKFHLAKYYILWTNKIPRGKGRSPKPFDTKEDIDVSKLAGRLEEAREALKRLDGLKEKQHFRHPIFGDLKLKEARKFVKIHTNHHLDIIEEIINVS